ncbi:MAG: PilZ domain-containing protein [Wenzhouxiangella sp.]|nr:MAG: PilZ domain-containing protein [Wenzhouxiangella sp.]
MIGDTLLVRFLHEGIVFGFRSTVSRVVSEPEFLLFVQYPKRVERFSVRDQRRWACGIPCIFDLGSQSGQAIMMNVNAKGCGVAALMHAGSDPPATDDILTIKLRTPESDRLHSLKGIVRRIECNERTWQAGILFEEDQEQMMEQVKPYLAIEAER